MICGQLVFGRDMVLNVQHLTDWTVIKKHKQQLIHKNNQLENSKQIPYQYLIGDYVMLENHQANKYQQPYSRPYRIQQVNTNETVCLKMGAVTDKVNIHSIHTFKSPDSTIVGTGEVCAVLKIDERLSKIKLL
jgi:hypothetical protein